ncbi:MAG: NAD(P)-dependent oxidoreductase [Patescibacteria group bacterium]|nr:NAD(P)-dependent oxidoreductase [Patescibacteria group bacterium]
MKNKRTIKNLVLGSSGYVGSAFTRFLEAKGEKVIPFDIKRSEKEDARFAKLPLKDVDRVYFIAWDVGGPSIFSVTNLSLSANWNGI